MKKTPILTIAMIALTILFISCSERTSKWLPQEITINQANNDTRIYKFLYDNENKLIGFDIAYTQTANDTTNEFIDSIRFEFGKDGRLVRSKHRSGNPNIKSDEASIYYMDNNTIQFDALDSTKTTLKINDLQQLLSVSTKGYEGGYLYDSLARIKSIAHNILVRDTSISHAQGLFRISMEYKQKENNRKTVFSDLDFPEWMLLYCALEVFIYNPDVVITQPDTTIDNKLSTALSYEYNIHGFPEKIRMTGHNNMTVDIKYREIR